MHDELREKVRIAAGHEPMPSAGSIDSHLLAVCLPSRQGLKNARTADECGYDAGKKINGIKRHIMVDTLGLLLVIVVHAANILESFANWSGTLPLPLVAICLIYDSKPMLNTL